MPAHRIDFWSLVDVRGPDDCWIWNGRLDTSGYGRVGKRSVPAHRLAYEERVGSIPPGLQLDHVCHTVDSECVGGVSCPHRRCVNPAHLEPVTKLENDLRGRSFSAVNAAKTCCSNGHPFSPENTYWRRGGRRGCRTCGRAATKRYLRRRSQRAA